MEPQVTGVAVGVVVASLPWFGFIAVTRTLNSLSHCDGLKPGIPEFSHHCLMSVAFSYLTFECCYVSRSTCARAAVLCLAGP